MKFMEDSVRTNVWGGGASGTEKLEFHSTKFAGDSEPKFFGGRTAGGKKLGELQSIKFVGDSEPTFGGTSGGENLRSFTV